MLESWFMALDGIRRKKTARKGCYFYRVVRKERLELSHLAALEPKSSASTNFATSALNEDVIILETWQDATKFLLEKSYNRLNLRQVSAACAFSDGL